MRQNASAKQPDKAIWELRVIRCLRKALVINDALDRWRVIDERRKLVIAKLFERFLS